MKSSSFLCSWTLLVLAGLSTPSIAQEVILDIESDYPWNTSFNKVAAYDDVTGDGIRELIVGQVGARVILVVSGSDGSTVHRLLGDTDSFGRTLARVGDFDGDGVLDFAVGEPNFPQSFDSNGRVVVYSGASGQPIVQVQGPTATSAYGYSALAGVGDVNGDGFADVAFGGFYGDDVHVHLGPDGAHLRSHVGSGTRPAVAGIGDIDGDGRPDYVVGWPQDSQGGLWAGKAVVYSGSTGSMIHEVFGSIPHNEPVSSGDHLGRAVAGTGDLDGDGVPDFACGAPGEINPHWGDLQRRVLVYSGADASLLFELDGTRDSEYNSWFGGSLAGGSDVNGDGVPDLLVGAQNEKGPFQTWSGSLSVYSGRTGTRIWHVYIQNGGATGQYVALVGDLNGDGLGDFATGNAWYQNSLGGQGLIRAWAGFQADAEVVCAASPSSAGAGALLEVGGDIALGSSWHTPPELIASAAPPGTPGLFFYGPPAAPTPFGDGTRCLGAPAFRLGPPELVEPDGTARREISFTQPPAGSGPGEIQPGSTWTFQLWYRDPQGGPAGFNLSEALRITFAP